jgi:hypothetical protein
MALVINNGKPEALKDLAQKALDAGIKVVAYYVNLDSPKIPQVEQSDAERGVYGRERVWQRREPRVDRPLRSFKAGEATQERSEHIPR